MCATHRRSAQLGRGLPRRARQAQLRALETRFTDSRSFAFGERPHGRLVLRRDRRERVAWARPRTSGRPTTRSPAQHRRAASAAERGSVAGPATPSAARWRVRWKRSQRRPSSRRRSGRRRRAAGDARRAPAELQRRDVPAVGALDEHAAGDERPAERAELSARSRPELARDRQPVSRWNVRRPFAVIGPATPSILPKYMPFERSDTWSPAISGSGAPAASACGAASRPATAAAAMSQSETHGIGPI